MLEYIESGEHLKICKNHTNDVDYYISVEYYFDNNKILSSKLFYKNNKILNSELIINTGFDNVYSFLHQYDCFNSNINESVLLFGTEKTNEKMIKMGKKGIDIDNVNYHINSIIDENNFNYDSLPISKLLYPEIDFNIVLNTWDTSKEEICNYYIDLINRVNKSKKKVLSILD